MQVVANVRQHRSDLQKITDFSAPIVVLWPENMMDEKYGSELQKFAKENHIYLAYNQAKSLELTKPGNTIVVIDSKGDVVLENYKRHAAPGEPITEKNVYSSFVLNDKKVTGDICYDLQLMIAAHNTLK